MLVRQDTQIDIDAQIDDYLDVTKRMQDAVQDAIDYLATPTLHVAAEDLKKWVSGDLAQIVKRIEDSGMAEKDLLSMSTEELIELIGDFDLDGFSGFLNSLKFAKRLAFILGSGYLHEDEEEDEEEDEDENH